MALPLAKINHMTHVSLKQNRGRPSLPQRPMMVSMSMSMSMSMSEKTSSSYLGSMHEDIEAHLKQAIPLREPLTVFEPMNHLVFNAPQSTAPALCIAACELVGGHRDQAVAAASALHLMHASAVTHEQLPLSDRPSLLPNSGPMIHHAFNPNIELLLPDGIVPFGFELLAKSNDLAQNKPDRVLRVIIEMSRAFGSQGIVEGQYTELLCNQLDKDESRCKKLINHVCEKKEGELHACGAACGAILGGGSEEEIEKLRRFGFYVGMMQGMSQKLALKGSNELIEELRNLALEELKGFNEAKVEDISSFVEVNSSQVHGV